MNDMSQELKRGFFFFLSFSSFSPVSYQPWQQMVYCLACAEFSLHIFILCLLLWTLLGAQCTGKIIFKAVFFGDQRGQKLRDKKTNTLLSCLTKRGMFIELCQTVSQRMNCSLVLLINAEILCYHSEAVALVGLLSLAVVCIYRHEFQDGVWALTVPLYLCKYL